MPDLWLKRADHPLAAAEVGNDTDCGGLPAITVAAVILTGILGSIVIPLLFTKLKIKNSVALGITLGTASHAMGTSKAIEIGEQEGGLSGLAIGITGIFTVILSLLL